MLMWQYDLSSRKRPPRACHFWCSLKGDSTVCVLTLGRSRWRGAKLGGRGVEGAGGGCFFENSTEDDLLYGAELSVALYPSFEEPFLCQFCVCQF